MRGRPSKFGSLAQLDGAPGYGPGGLGFESLASHLLTGSEMLIKDDNS